MNLDLTSIQKAPLTEPFLHSSYPLISDDLASLLIINFFQIKSQLHSDKKLSPSRFLIRLTGSVKTGINYRGNNFLQDIYPLNKILKLYGTVIAQKLHDKYYPDEKGDVKYVLSLVYDTKNYSIGPHTDSKNRKASMITFLVPKSDTHKKLGTFLYQDLINRHPTEKSWNPKHYSFDNFKPVKQIEYINGNAVDFKVSKDSFHGVPAIECECDRMSFQLIIVRQHLF